MWKPISGLKTDEMVILLVRYDDWIQYTCAAAAYGEDGLFMDQDGNITTHCIDDFDVFMEIPPIEEGM